MSGLIGGLASAARALEAQRFGLEIAGENIANVNTPGYTRRTALLSAVPSNTARTAGLGVSIAGLDTARDARLEARLLHEQPSESRERAKAEALSLITSMVGAPGASIDAAMAGFFDGFAALAEDPTSPAVRTQAVYEGRSVAMAFRDMSGRLARAGREADRDIRSTVEDINAAARDVVRINRSLASLSPASDASYHLQDELGVALKKLAQFIDIQALPRPNGGFDVMIGNGRPLVMDVELHELRAEATTPDGRASIFSGSAMVTSEISGGSIAGLLQIRDTHVPAYVDALDAMAYAFATEVNARHQAGYRLDGAAAGSFFTPPAAVAGAAAGLEVAADILADPSRVAAGAAPVAGDNGVAREIAALRDAPIGANGGTLHDEWARLVYRVGADTRAAESERDSRGEIVRQLGMLRERVSGVSLDEEAMTMMKFQRAYEASARYFRAIDQALDTLLQAIV